MKNRHRAAFATAIAALATVANVTIAHAADIGDGKLACNAGEICLSKDYPSTTYQKQFWYSASHGGYYFTNVQSGAATNTPVQNNVSGVRNRDSSCVVKIVNDRGILPDNYVVIQNDSAWHFVGSEMNDANDRHERCSA